jgi:hypothetical protein
MRSRTSALHPQRIACRHHARGRRACAPQDDDRCRMAGLLPILWSTGTGSGVMQRIAVPMNPVDSRRDSFDLCDRERDRDITAARHVC